MQNIVFSSSIMEEVEEIRNRNHYNDVFLVCSNRIAESDLGQAMKLCFPGIEIFSDFTCNPKYEEVCSGLEQYLQQPRDAIVAIGGGSAIDVAKCIKLFSGLKNDSVFVFQEYRTVQTPLIAIPTTAGTGSESTKHAVIYYQGEKQSISHECIIPDYAIINHEFLRTLPLYQKECTMLDAFCHAIESWWSKKASEESIMYSREALELIQDNYYDYLYSNDEEAAKKMMYASNLAGRAINITATTAAHAMSYKISSIYKIPHGHAVAIVLPKLWTVMLNKADNNTMKVFSDIANCFHKNTVQETISWISDFLESIKIESPKFIEMDKELKILSESVNEIRLKNNPIELSLEEIKLIYKEVLQ